MTTWTAAHRSLPIYRKTSLSSPDPRACSNSHPLSRWCHPIISSSVAPFSSCRQSFPVSGSFPVSWHFASGGQSWSFSFSISPSSEYSGLISFRIDWFDLLQSKGPLRIFCNTTVQKQQFFGAQLSLWYNSHIHTWLLKNHSFNQMDLCRQSNISAFEYAI